MMSQEEENESTRQLRSKEPKKEPSDDISTYISRKKKVQEDWSKVLGQGDPTLSLEQIILLQKLQKPSKFHLLQKIKLALKQNFHIRTTSRVSKYLLQFFIKTILIQIIKDLTDDQILKNQSKQIIFKKIMEKQGGKMNKGKFGCNCQNLQLLLRSDKIFEDILDQSTIIDKIIDKIMASKVSFEMKMYYICFIPKLKQIRSMDKKTPYLQVWRKNDIRSIEQGKRIVKHYQKILQQIRG